MEASTPAHPYIHSIERYTMSIIYGLFKRDGYPVTPEDTQFMHDALSIFPHEQKGIIMDRNAAFGHFLTHNTPESLFENLPIYLPEEKLFFTATGRVDNRHEIASLLNIELFPEIADGELILRIYLKFGKKCAEQILGDWSFAAFHFDRQELFIARDHHGNTSIFYYMTEKFIAFSSNIKGLLALPSVNKELNKDALLHTLAIWYPIEYETYYKNIYLLPPAHSLTAGTDTFVKKRYWFPENIEIVKRKSPEDVAAELEDIFVSAIKARLRSHKPVASMLSGGLDSGSVSYLAAELLKKNGTVLTTFSHIPQYDISRMESANRFGNEKPFIEKTVNASGNINPIYLDSRDVSVLDGILTVIDMVDGPIHGAANAYWIADLPANTARNGFGTLLSGEHGNSTISFAGIGHLLPWKHYQLTNSSLRSLLKNKIGRPLLFNSIIPINSMLKKTRGLRLTDYSYIDPQYAEKICLKGQMLNSGHDRSFNANYSSSREKQLRILQVGANSRCFYGAATSQYFGIEKRDPTADKRVIEYIMTIPNELYFDRGGNGKNIIKKMMAEKLPNEVLYNKAKGLQSADIGQRVMAEKDRMDDQINRIIKNEFAREMIDLNRLSTTWDKIKENHAKDAHNPAEVSHFLRTIMTGMFMTKF